MQRISKPHLVDLLRVFDRRRYLVPRIRYASVRSKPELIRDLERHFCVYIAKNVIEFLPRRRKARSKLPRIEYSLQKRQYIFDGEPYDAPVMSRQKVLFHISYDPVTVTFPRIVGSPLPRPSETTSLPSKQRDVAAFQVFQARGLGALPGF